ncbi:hypothetical protein [Aquimarina sp. 2201CG5-10]|uniref:hypothetical protein n=1 Tax=Aquimarina callyspongiae TaxID=3098150 RepID=UPI002AB34983|nr:hypothetical protein [Aquimarina sp. 2201CG5-10]MDY8134472.1 hypothetical protein [Aquimarina sp. 2201CG5-10]
MKRNYEKIDIKFEENEILFSNGYYFKQSPVHKRKKIVSNQVSEINLNTFPPSLVYQENEVIFVKHELKNALEKFATVHKIPIINRFDIWEHINLPYLDTEFEEHEKNQSKDLLSQNGIDELELKNIRKKIARTMAINFLVWEWNYLGLFDYLVWTYLNKKKYWWSMEIALRNYKKEI